MTGAHFVLMKQKRKVSLWWSVGGGTKCLRTWTGLSILQTADLLGFSQWRNHRQGWQKMVPSRENMQGAAVAWRKMPCGCQSSEWEGCLETRERGLWLKEPLAKTTVCRWAFVNAQHHFLVFSASQCCYIIVAESRQYNSITTLRISQNALRTNR